MLDIKLIRENPDVVREALNKRGEDAKKYCRGRHKVCPYQLSCGFAQPPFV